jgi:ATP-binding cassette subfamily F protein uup
VLDEPTNDLDIETLELLEALLTEWPGTLLLVSHDRAFIDHVVTSTLVFEGEGRVHEYVGGYSDWMHQKRHAAPKKPAPKNLNRRRGSARPVAGTRSSEPRDEQALLQEQKELEKLPARIEGLETEQQQLNAAVASPGFYKEGPEKIHQTLARLEELQQALLDAYARWDELDSRT